MSSRENETLDLRHMGEVAGVIAKNAGAVLEVPGCLTTASLQTYWVASRKRADLWQYALDDALDASRRDQPLGEHAVRSSSSVIAEVLSTELITRLWCAVVVGHEKRHGQRHEVLARRVLSDHLTARRSCLKLLTHPIALPSAEIVKLDRVRQRAERWTDCLLATLPTDCSAEEFAFDDNRFDEFADDSDMMTRLSTRLSGWHLLTLSLRVGRNEDDASDSTRTDLHRDVLDSIGTVIDAAASDRRPKIVPLSNVDARSTGLETARNEAPIDLMRVDHRSLAKSTKRPVADEVGRKVLSRAPEGDLGPDRGRHSDVEIASFSDGLSFRALFRRQR